MKIDDKTIENGHIIEPYRVPGSNPGGATSSLSTTYVSSVPNNVPNGVKMAYLTAFIRQSPYKPS